MIALVAARRDPRARRAGHGVTRGPRHVGTARAVRPGSCRQRRVVESMNTWIGRSGRQARNHCSARSSRIVARPLPLAITLLPSITMPPSGGSTGGGPRRLRIALRTPEVGPAPSAAACRAAVHGACARRRLGRAQRIEDRLLGRIGGSHETLRQGVPVQRTFAATRRRERDRVVAAAVRERRAGARHAGERARREPPQRRAVERRVGRNPRHARAVVVARRGLLWQQGIERPTIDAQRPAEVRLHEHADRVPAHAPRRAMPPFQPKHTVPAPAPTQPTGTGPVVALAGAAATCCAVTARARMSDRWPSLVSPTTMFAERTFSLPGSASSQSSRPSATRCTLSVAQSAIGLWTHRAPATA